jgi:hypothetical protein
MLRRRSDLLFPAEFIGIFLSLLRLLLSKITQPQDNPVFSGWPAALTAKVQCRPVRENSSQWAGMDC